MTDTAGMRKILVNDENTEKHSGLRAMRAIGRPDVVLIILMLKKEFGEYTSGSVGFAHEVGK